MRRWLLAALSIAVSGCALESASDRKPMSFEGAHAQQGAAKIAHGRRIADVLGCTGCHGSNLQGERFYELYASNLTRDLANYNDQQIERVLKRGITPSGRDLWGMPSEIFQHLSGPDIASLIAYLRTLRPSGAPTQPKLPFPPDVLEMIAKGELKPASAAARDAKNLAPMDLGPAHDLGRYIARVTCAECHGPELGGGSETPDLIVAGAYSRDEFERLMVHGVGTGGRKLKPLMEGVAKGRFSKMSTNERDALYGYLKARAEQIQ